jgi:UDP-N-acetylglucosamine 2-epimerase (non-hydrolysing)
MTARTPAKVLLVAGARPNFMKVAPIYWAWQESARDRFQVELVHTGQHYDAAMSDDFFRDLRLPAPDVNLGVGSASHAVQTAKIMSGFEQVLLERRPEVVIVVGDVNSTLACALVTAKIEIDLPSGRSRPLLVHVEAGLRSRDRAMPEEVNRIVADAVSDVLFTTCRDADENLLAEGVPAERIRFVGNPMIDSLRRCLGEGERAALLDDLGLRGRRFGLCTLHRPSNVDHAETLRSILGTLGEIAQEAPILIPLHPRTRARIEEFGLGDRLTDRGANGDGTPARGLVPLAPVPYLMMLQLLRGAAFVLTDSGGIPEEATALGVACVTLRENTERPVTITEGTNVLGGLSRRGILDGLREARRKSAAARRVPELWDGRAGERIVDALSEMAGAA